MNCDAPKMTKITREKGSVKIWKAGKHTPIGYPTPKAQL